VRERRIRRLLAARRAGGGRLNVNVWDVNQQVQALIRSGQPVDLGPLCDPDTPLDSLVGELTA
jgi:hypothetical protein